MAEPAAHGMPDTGDTSVVPALLAAVAAHVHGPHFLTAAARVAFGN